MSTCLVEGPAILIGYAYRVQLESEAPLFPKASEITAHVRLKPSDGEVLATLTSADGELVRESDYLLTLTIPATATAMMPVGSVVLDMVRRDVTPALPLGFALEIPVILPVTRGLT